MNKILISCSYSFGDKEDIVRIDNAYTNAVLNAGDLPLPIGIEEDEEKVNSYLDLSDGLILSGGIDICPLMYDDYVVTEMDFHDKRDLFEARLFEGAIKRNLPILAICRGLQLVNVLRGGSLYQDLVKSGFTESIHTKKEKDPFIDEVYHYVYINKDSLLYKILGKEKLRVNSIHHQAVKNLGEGIAINCKSPDGLVEGFELKDYKKFLATQFHPERLHLEEDFNKIFKSFLGGYGE